VDVILVAISLFHLWTSKKNEEGQFALLVARFSVIGGFQQASWSAFLVGETGREGEEVSG
jgi:hypothetical protein